MTAYATRVKKPRRAPQVSPARQAVPGAHRGFDRSPPPGPAGVLHLQRTIGNQAVLRIVQRLPTSASVKGQLGKTKRSWRIGHGSTKYKGVLNALDAYQDYISSTRLDRFSFVAQFQQALTLLARIETACQAYQGKRGAKADYFINQLLPAIQRERSFIAQTALNLKLNGMPPGMQFGGPTLAGVMLTNVGALRQKELTESQVTGSDKGGSKEVTKFNIGGSTSYFKETKQTLYSGTDPWSEGHKGLEANALQNEAALGVRMLGIDPNDARMANRDVAMARLDQLLGGGVIAKAELVKRHLPTGETVTGSLMEGAKDKSAGDLMLEGKFSENKTDQEQKGKGFLNREDPNLMRLLSRLQLIDLLCMQVDRNPRNYFIQMDDSGKVVAITGIDNDFSLGTKANIQKRRQELPGFSRWVDKELAEKIIGVDLALVAVIMSDLLSPAEIEALIKRFRKVQDHLRDIKTMLLEPHEWTDAVSKGLLQEDKSYYADIDFWRKGKFKPPKQ